MAGGGGRGVCKFFLEGGCKFGDRCKFFHPSQRNPQGHNNVCKFFLEGNCKFGERCKYYHPTGGGGGGGYRNNQRNVNTRHQQAPPIDTGRGWNNQRERRGRLYSHEEIDSGMGDNQTGWDRGRREDRGGGGGGGGGFYQPRGMRDQQQTNDRYHYSSPDYSRQRGERSRFHDGNYRGERRELFSETSQRTQTQLTDPDDIATQIRNDMSEAEGMWLFTCYAYTKEAPCVPELQDLSPEELRLLAYVANKAGTSAAFLQNVEELREKQKRIRRLYANITSEEVKKMLSMTATSLAASSSDSSTLFSSPISSSPMATPSIFHSSTAPKLFQDMVPAPSLPAPSPVPVTPQTTPSHYVPPSSSITPSTIAIVSPGNTDSSKKLTQEELDAYKAPVFVLGKVPENPPPPDLC